MSQHSGALFYLLDHSGQRRVPYKVRARDGRYGYALHPRGKGNDASAAEYSEDVRRLVEAVVLEGRGVRCRAGDGPNAGQLNTLYLNGRAVRGYWLAPQHHDWVRAATQAPLPPSESDAHPADVTGAGKPCIPLSAVTPADAGLLQTATRAREAEGAVLVEVMEVSWPHPHEPATRWVTVTRLPLSAEPATVDAARAKLLRSRRYFGVCAECGERSLRGHMFGRELCAGCAERVLQVRF